MKIIIFIITSIFSFAAIANTSGTSQEQNYDKPQSNLESIYAPKGSKVVGNVMDTIDLKINKIIFSGNTKFNNSDLQNIANNVKKTNKLSDAYKLAEKITTEYRKKGFILSRAIVPEHIIKNGVLKIHIIEGFIDNIIIKGAKEFEKFVDTEKITNSKPLKINDLERSLLLLKDIPGLNVTSILTPSTKSNASNLVINLTVKKISGSVKVDNYGTKFIGPLRTTVNTNFNSIFGIGSLFKISATLATDNTGYSNNELKSYNITGNIPITNNGTRLNIFHSNSSVNPGHTMKDLEAQSKNNIWELSISHPIIRQRIQSLKFQAGLNYKNLYTDLLGKEFTKDRIRSVFGEITYDFADNMSGVNLINFKIDKGLNKDSATQLGSLLSTKPEANPNYIKFSGRVARQQSLSKFCNTSNNIDFCNKFSIFLSSNWQFSDQPLFSSEEFSVGGRVFGRGYDLGEISGDKGIAANIELHFNDTYKALDYDLYSFFDFGTIRNVDESEKGGENEKKIIRSFGVGVKANYEDWDFALEVAKPLADKPSALGDKDPRVFAEIVYKF